MLRVVQLVTDELPYPPPKGDAIEKYIYGISRKLAKNGVEVHIISLPSWKKVQTFKHIKNVIHYPIKLNHYKAMLSQPLLIVSFSAIFRKKIQI
ncbi:MAG: hypothetical protein QXM43_01235 [Desulfurococcaceae archaeon]